MQQILWCRHEAFKKLASFVRIVQIYPLNRPGQLGFSYIDHDIDQNSLACYLHHGLRSRTRRTSVQLTTLHLDSVECSLIFWFLKFTCRHASAAWKIHQKKPQNEVDNSQVHSAHSSGLPKQKALEKSAASEQREEIFSIWSGLCCDFDADSLS